MNGKTLFKHYFEQKTGCKTFGQAPRDGGSKHNLYKHTTFLETARKIVTKTIRFDIPTVAAVRMETILSFADKKSVLGGKFRYG